MDAIAKSIANILHTGDQYIIPLFQRSYSWQKAHWLRLYSDISALMENSEQKVHFLGPLVCTSNNKNLRPGGVPNFQLIDGQQRLTTLTVALAALRDVAIIRGESQLAEEIMEDYLVHKRREGVERFKVLPRTGDREALTAIIENRDHSAYADLRIVHAWRFFKRQISHGVRLNSVGYLRDLFDTVTQRLSLVVITIDGENPYEIFESLNATGLPLAESDLIRNYIFMQVPLAQQTEFEKREWGPVEQPFDSWGDERAEVMTGFYRDYLMRDGAYSREKCTFVDFKDQQKSRGLTASQQAAELLRFAPLGVAIRKPELCQADGLKDVLGQISFMDIGTAYPLVLNLLGRHQNGALSEPVVKQCLMDLVSFVLRRTICNESTRGYGRIFIDAIRAVGDDPLGNLRAFLTKCGWPDDETVAAAFDDFALYHREPRKALMILRELERSHGHKERVSFSNLTIEHVLPQTVGDDEPGLSWQRMLGDEWDVKHERYLHTLGNLTLTAYNSPIGNKSYDDKRAFYKDSHVDLNKYFTDFPMWGVDEIRARTAGLAGKVCQMWPRPEGACAYHGAESGEETEAEGSRASKRNQEYWARFLKEWNNALGISLGDPSTGVSQLIPLNEEGTVIAHLWTKKQQRRQVAFVEFKRKAIRLYDFMASQKQLVDDMVEGDIIWDSPWRGCFCVVEDDVSFADKTDWPVQHSWFCEELEDMVLAVRKGMQDVDKVTGPSNVQ